MHIIDWTMLALLGTLVLLMDLLLGVLPAVLVSGSRFKIGCIGLPVAAFSAALSGLCAFYILDITQIGRDYYSYSRGDSHGQIVMTLSIVFGAVAFLVAFLPSLGRIVAGQRTPWDLPAGSSDSSSWLLPFIVMNAATDMNMITNASIMNSSISSSTPDFSSFNQPPSNF